MILKTMQNSLWDYLVQLMPGVKTIIMVRPQVNQKAAKTLLSLWKDEKNVLGAKKLKKPVGISLEDINSMVKEDLVRHVGDELEITTKGEQVLKTMILGDDRSVFEENGETLDYETALANTKVKRRIVKGNKVASGPSTGGNWYKRLK